MKSQTLRPAFLTFLTLSVSFFSATAQVKGPDINSFQNPFQQNKKTPEDQVTKPKPNSRAGGIDFQLRKGNENISKDIRTLSLTKSQLEGNLVEYLGLSNENHLSKVREESDKLGYTHSQFQQYYKSVRVEGGVILLHTRNGSSEYINGSVTDLGNSNTTPSISPTEAVRIASEHLKVVEALNEYPAELVFTSVPGSTGSYKLAYKTRIDASKPFGMHNVYVDAQNGQVLNTVSLIPHADAVGIANTLYSGTQSITHDSFSGGFRLRDGARKIETYNATNASFGASGFVGFTDFSNPTSTWGAASKLSSVTISTIAQAWWFTTLVDEIPDLYIKIKDGAGQTVYQSGYLPDTNVPITFNGINLQLNNPPYSLELWDYDAGSSDDSGGSYPISVAAGTQNWAGNGNTGNYLIQSQNNPALDVHWGMEKTFDFYLNTFGRNSFDGLGSTIKNFVNGSLQTQGTQNNAGALHAPYNVMVYGMGDGILMKPVVALDVEGHEFTHMVINNNGTGGLTYQGESGALNESFADIMGTAVEFFTYGAGANWSMGENIMVSYSNLRSMSDPKNSTGYSQQPNTYGGQYWTNPANINDDHGGVHTNSGVQNYWFYLLAQGGSGTNDLGKTYSVTGIGISQAAQIAYKNLTTYLTPNATYTDAYNGSLRAAEDLYGNPSTQYTAVRAAWYAVGIGNDPLNYCTGVTKITTSTGTISDGSGNANYNNNTSCKWVIAPPGANQVTLNFTTFDTEANFDVVTVYDGPDDTSPVLATWWGSTLPPTINSTGGALCIKFVSDGTLALQGWAANYTSTGSTPSCSGGSILAAQSGSLNDGSGANNYGNNQLCYWLIAPPCATSVTLTVTQLNTEQNYDGIIVYNGPNTSSPQLGAFSGTSLPSPVTASSGQMLVVFISDYSTVSQGFSATYVSTGSATCSGTTTMNTQDYGIISDGSGANNYCNNLDCQWLIQPPQATKVTLNFTAFDLENPSSDGQSIYDAVEVYDGTTTAAPLLGRFSGSNIPPAVTSTGGSLLIRFYSDPGEAKQGWSAYYTSQTTTYCSGPTTLTAASGSFTDGSGANSYGNNTLCSWLIQPANAGTITLSFTAFDTELNADGIIVHDGATSAAPVLAVLSGPTIPTPITSTGGTMYLEFISDEAVRGNGWAASYSITTIVGLESGIVDQQLKFYPNPANLSFTVKSEYETRVELQVLDVQGRTVLPSADVKKGYTTIDISKLSSGIYLLNFQVDGKSKVKRLVVP